METTNIILKAVNHVTRYPEVITSTDISGTQSMDIFVNNESTTNLQSKVGLNMYRILPKMKSLAVSGMNNYAVQGTLMAGQGSKISVTTDAWGKANSNKTFYLYSSGTSQSKPISYTYIDSAGDERTGTADASANNYIQLQANIVGVNNFSMANNYQFVTADAYYITLTPASTGNADTAAAQSVCSINGPHYSMQNCIFTVPNNAIAMITSVDAILSAANEYYYMNIWDASGNRDVPWVGYMYASGVNNMRTAGGGDYGCIGRILKAGETVAFYTIASGSTYKNVLANIRVVYF